WKRFALAGFLGLLLASMFIGPYQPMRYHGGVILTLVLTGAVGLGGILSRWPRLGLPLAVLILVLPVFQCYRTVLARSGRNPVEATAWIEDNVPPGTIVYLYPAFQLRPLLPTEKAADAIWTEVTDQQAWRRKFARGLRRFHLSLDYIPRCLSEV